MCPQSRITHRIDLEIIQMRHEIGNFIAIPLSSRQSHIGAPQNQVVHLRIIASSLANPMLGFKMDILVASQHIKHNIRQGRHHIIRMYE